jgi:hypothetical protein
MGLRRSLLVDLVAVALGAACRGEPRGGTPIAAKVPLRYHPPPGAVYRYVLEQTSRFGPDSAAADSAALNTMTLVLSETIGPRGTEGVPVTVTFDSSGVASPMLDAAAAAAAAQQLRGLRVTMVLDERFRPVRTDLSALDELPALVREQVQLGIRAAALAFPEHPVGPGDGWTNRTELPFARLTSGAPLTVDTRITVREITVTRGDTTVRLAVESGLPERPLQFDLGGQPVTVTLRGGITGEQLFSLTRGAVVNGTLGGTMHLRVAGGFFGRQGMAMRLEQQASTRLVETR